MQILKENYITASYLILFGVIMDGFDGTIARITKTESNFGMQFDSLVDAVTFGLVTSVMINLWGFQSLRFQIGQVIGFIFLSAGVIRLARFNVYQEAKAHPPNIFIGLPIPIASLSVLSIILYFEIPPKEEIYTIIFAVFVIIIAFLMISNIKYRTLKRINPKYSLLVLFVLATIIAFSIKYPSYTIPLMTFCYLISPLFFVVTNKIKKGRKKNTLESNSD